MSTKDEKKSLLKNAEPINHDEHNDIESGGREIGEIFPDGLTTAEANKRYY